jgi:hypothetical protein
MRKPVTASSSALLGVLDAQLRDRATGWSIGTWGAVADLERAADEPSEHEGLTMSTARGAVRIESIQRMRPVAYERCLRAPGSWRQALALCLPAADAIAHRRTTVTELGPDERAIHAEDRDVPLFDLGIGCACADFCVRTGNPELLGALRRATGRSVWDSSTRLHALLTERSPTRVVLTRAVRAEVTTPIPPPGATTPPGPHTHLLRKLLATERTHPAIEPIPAGWVPVATIFPAHPLLDPGALAIAFDSRRHHRFQALLRAHGDPIHVETKDIVGSAVRSRVKPWTWQPGPGSVARNRATRVALRQLTHTDPDAPGLPAWRSAFGEPTPTMDRIGSNPNSHASGSR